MRIVVLDGYTLNPGDNPWDPVSQLGQLTVYDRTGDEKIIERAADAEIVLTNKTPLSGRTIEQLAKLKMISVLATGHNVVDVAAARKRGIDVCNVPVYGTDSVAQFVFALLLEVSHHVALHNQAVHDGDWSEGEDFSFWKTPLIELAGKIMGIVGFGRIGRRVGELAHAFGMEVLGCDVVRREAPPYAPFAWAELGELFETADVVSLYCPHTPQNIGMVNAEMIARMKDDAILINTARGSLVVEPDLAEALNAGKLAAAAVDVVSTEPIRADNPLLSAPNCIITPHIAWAALDARKRLMKATAANVAAFLAAAPINVVN